jgi:phospholipid/cholesterol/gamma-HCH transport system substrate-binding protein
VQLDEIFRAFDPRTRAAFQAWMQGQAASLRGRGEDFSVAIASLPEFADSADRLLRLLESQDVAVSDFVRNTGDAFSRLSERSGQLRGTIENSAAVFATTAERNEELAEIFRIFPTFLRESRETLTRLEQFAIDTDPVAVGLQPAARELTPTLAEVQQLAPVLDTFFVGLTRAVDVGPAGLRATSRLLESDLPPILEGFDPWLAQFNPILQVFADYRREVAGAIANLAAASNGIFFDIGTGEELHYLRSMAPLNPEAVSTYPRRLTSSRSNPYFKPGAYENVASGLESFETRGCTFGINAFLDPTTPQNPTFNERTEGDVALAQAFYDRLQRFAFAGQENTQSVPAPPCRPQGPFQSIGESPEESRYLHTRESP